MVSVSIVGGTGYTGAELLRIIAHHPEFELHCVTSRGDAGTPLGDVWPHLRGHYDISFSVPDIAQLADSDLVFFATPNGTAMQSASELLERGVKVVDLSADFRLQSPEVWEQWYGQPHASTALLAEAVYGLPELSFEKIASAQLVANPGCYPTAILLGLIPLLKKQLIRPEDIIADAKSGVSGAGRGASVNNLFGEVSENFHAYGVGGHRHHPEMMQVLTEISATAPGLTFIPHLLPMFRGMQATLYVTMIDENCDVEAALVAYYADKPFVNVDCTGRPPETRDVLGTNYCTVSVNSSPVAGRAIVLSVIDNLTKGAAGQAIQNANIMCGLDQSLGLHTVALRP